MINMETMVNNNQEKIENNNSKKFKITFKA
jgi:hypothetical protein